MSSAPAAAELALEALPRAVPLIAVTDDLHWRRDAKTQFCNMSDAIKRRELAVYRRAALTLTITAEDAHELRAQLPKLRLGVLPYALDAIYQCPVHQLNWAKKLCAPLHSLASVESLVALSARGSSALRHPSVASSASAGGASSPRPQ